MLVLVVGHLLYRLHNQTQKRLVLLLDQGQLVALLLAMLLDLVLDNL